MSALKPAHSSWIAFHGYSNGVMTLITKSGESYAANMPESRYSDFLKSPSQGSFFNLYIKPFAKVTKVDVTEDVALVEAAKARVALDSKVDDIKAKLDALATPSTVTVPKKASRKAPAKSLLPKKQHTGTGTAWIDFRCIADPTTGPGLVAALKRFMVTKDKNLAGYWPITSCDKPIGIAELRDWGTGYVDPKYLKAYPNGAPVVGLANAYRAAYRSWVKRQEAKKAKVKESVVKMVETAAKEVFAGGWTGKTAEQVRAEKAEAVLKALEEGCFSVLVGPAGGRLGAAGYGFLLKRS